MSKRDRLEPQPDGFVAFHTESGERWKHKDVVEDGATGAGYRLFVSERGEERRYYFRPRETRDATISDLRMQLAAAKPASTAAAADAPGARA
ncbi:MAG TPA: hypothetical protein VNA89_05065 [Gemmatimonadaceae bacterium]|nr:hypothetical protein [Gemmatimonadaceae bacterium]